jgi:hypothetical protein
MLLPPIAAFCDLVEQQVRQLKKTQISRKE